MRILLLALAVFPFAVLRGYATDELPPVEDGYRSMGAQEHLGEPIEEIIAIDEIQRIVLFKERLNAHRAKEPAHTADLATKLLFEQTQPAKDLARLAEEIVVAEFVVVNKNGDVFFVDVLRHMSAFDQVATAFTLRGKGFGCRFELDGSQYKAH